MANISSINGNPIVVGTSGIANGAVTDEKLAQSGGIISMVQHINSSIADLDQMDITVRDNLVYDINHLHISDTTYNKVVDGVYTFTAPPSGSRWATYLVSDSDLQQGIAKWVVNVVSCEDGSKWTAYRMFKTVQGDTRYKKVSDITKAGRYEFDIDLNYMSVYENYDGNGVSLSIANNASAGKTIVIDQYDLTEKVSDFDNLPRSLNSVLNEVRGDIDALEHAAAPELVLRSYTGDGYVLQVDKSGNLKVVPVLPSNILYIGNSLLIGFGTHGMASTDVGDDYYGKVNAYLTSKGVTPTTIRLSGGRFEEAENDTMVNSWLDGTLANYMSSDRELVLIQLGDNVNTDAKRAEFAKSAGMLCSYVREHCPNARVAWVGEWYYSTINRPIIRDACSKYGCTFIDISDLPDIEGNRNRIGATYIDANGDKQTITNQGVASHPSDQGFTQIAERIIAALFE